MEATGTYGKNTTVNASAGIVGTFGIWEGAEPIAVEQAAAVKFNELLAFLSVNIPAHCLSNVKPILKQAWMESRKGFTNTTL